MNAPAEGGFAATLLGYLCRREPEGAEFHAPALAREEALATPRMIFPGFDSLIREKAVVDYGCGWGYQSAALLESGASRVLCLETSPERLDGTRKLLEQRGIANRALCLPSAAQAPAGSFDVVLSLDAMEHYGDPAVALREMSSLLRSGGKALICFGPPWFSPYGAHVHYFTPLPWVHLIFPERAVLAVRARYRTDGARRYEDVDGGLNRLGLHRFETLLRSAGFHVIERRYDCVKGLNFLSRIPLLRELFVNRVSVVLEKA